MKIKVFITGGTIDGCDLGVKIKKSVVPELLKKIKTDSEFNFEVLMLKDSREITEKDREMILQKCLSCKEDKIIITHGTMTMTETGKFLLNKKIDKTIILTGAMIPAGQEGSDALERLNFAVQAVETKPSSVYVAMSGQVFDADNVRKNLETGIFEKIS
jgi:L-asparaginase